MKMSADFTRDMDIKRSKRYLWKIFKLYLLWTAIYLPLQFIIFIRNKYSISEILLRLIRNLVLRGEGYNSYILWYLHSTILALCIIIIMQRKKASRNAYWIFGIFMAFITVIISNISNNSDIMPGFVGLFGRLISATIGSGRVFWGIAYISFGMLLYHKKMMLVTQWLMMIIGIIGCYVFPTYIPMKLFGVCISIGLFQIVSGLRLKPALIYTYLQKISVVMYLMHLYIWSVYYCLFYGKQMWSWDCFIVTTIVSILLGIIYCMFVKRYSNSFGVMRN